MKLSSQFTVPAEPERVFPLLFDPDVMRTSIPGCSELVRDDDDTYRGRLENVIAHVRFNAGFTAKIVSIDAPRHVGALLQGQDRKLGSSIKIDAKLSVQPDPAGSLVGYQMEMALWGKIGRLGEALVRRRSVEIERQFVERFSAACAVDTASTSDTSDASETESAARPAALAEPAAGPTRSAAPATRAAPDRPAPRRRWWQRISHWWQRTVRRRDNRSSR
ncbi:SRPBCC domain-containing protein [Streptomyces sp. MP131-18]|uniref:CoxG family protein n=1 Tax=Streptomyces sp. MP131-18 TaxID=1857892 RepID=UPI00097C4E9E|nr:SRPBCC domain-containing protein [Streptomyces sp. MP131-18]ONK14335.1 hypothetical protein STBA_51190 [Streptomyces sp. MP131-18]